jgi:uncharacterized protein (TIGR04255 family)
MTSRALGTLPNAPLAYVLAQVRFQPILEMHKAVPAIQTALRKRYPRFREIKIAGFELGPTGPRVLEPAPRWEFVSESSRQGVILQSNSLVLHATEYSTYQNFGADLATVVKILENQVEGILVDRLGLRYVDLIVPRPGESLDGYVVQSLAATPDPGIEFARHSGVTVADYTINDGGRLVIRFTRGKGVPPLPPDLQPLDLDPSDIMRRSDIGNVDCALLDTDRFHETTVPFVADDLCRRFHVLHEHISSAFKSLSTAYAREVWSQQKGDKP